jgi:hypothetical protein
MGAARLFKRAYHRFPRRAWRLAAARPPQNSAGRVTAPRQRPPGRPRGRGGCDRVRARARHPHIRRPLARPARGLDAPVGGALLVAGGARRASGRRRAGGHARAAAAGALRRGPAEQRPRHPVRPRGSGPVAAAPTAGLLQLNASVKDASQGQPNSSRPDPDPGPNPNPKARRRPRSRPSVDRLFDRVAAPRDESTRRLTRRPALGRKSSKPPSTFLFINSRPAC